MPETGLAILGLIILVVAVAMPLLAARRLRRQMQQDLEDLAGRLSEPLDAPAKFLEVRTYCSDMEILIQEVFEEARRLKDRRLRESAQRLLERLQTMRGRVLESTTRLLDDERAARRRKK